MPRHKDQVTNDETRLTRFDSSLKSGRAGYKADGIANCVSHLINLVSKLWRHYCHKFPHSMDDYLLFPLWTEGVSA